MLASRLLLCLFCVLCPLVVAGDLALFMVLLGLCWSLGRLWLHRLVGTTFGDMCVLLFPSFCYCIDFIESLLVGWTDCVVFSKRFIFIV